MDANLHMDMGHFLTSSRVYNKLVATEKRLKLQWNSFCRLYNIIHHPNGNFYSNIRLLMENIAKDAWLWWF